MNDDIITGMFDAITLVVELQGFCGQLFGSWNNDFSPEDHEQLTSLLAAEGIEAVKIYEYSELYFPEAMDDCEKQKLIEAHKKIAPLAFEEAAAAQAQRRRQEMVDNSITELLNSLENMRNAKDVRNADEE